MSKQWMAEVDGVQYEVTPILRIRYEGTKALLEQLLAPIVTDDGDDKPGSQPIWASVPTVGVPHKPSRLIGLDGTPVKQ